MPPRGNALHYAAFCGLKDVVKVLAIEHPEDVNSGNFDKQSTPLHLASGEGHAEAAGILVEHGADAAARTTNGSTPLFGASLRGHLELARILIEHGADAAARAKDGS